MRRGTGRWGFPWAFNYFFPFFFSVFLAGTPRPLSERCPLLCTTAGGAPIIGNAKSGRVAVPGPGKDGGSQISFGDGGKWRRTPTCGALGGVGGGEAGERRRP